MKKDLSSIEIRVIVAELQFLMGSRLDKVMQSGDSFLFSLYVRAKGAFFLKVMQGKYVYLTKNRPESDNPGNFCTSLRNRLDNSFIKEISQEGSERIVKIVFETKESMFTLFLEMFGKGNMILCDSKGMILALLDRQRWKDRTVAVKAVYEPPRKELNLFDAGQKDIEKLRHSAAGSLIKALATDLGMGGVYAEEICLSAAMDKNMAPDKLTDPDIRALAGALVDILARKPEPKSIIKDGKILNIVPFSMKYYQGDESQGYATFNEALDDALSKQAYESEKAGSTGYSKKQEKFMSIISAQQKSLGEVSKAAEEDQRKGEAIYENYAAVKEIIDGLKKASEKHSWAEIKRRLKGHKMIKSVDEKEKRVVVEI